MDAWLKRWHENEYKWFVRKMGWQATSDDRGKSAKDQDRHQLIGMWFDYKTRPERLEGWRGHRLWNATQVRVAIDKLTTKGKPITAEAIAQVSGLSPKKVSVAHAKLKDLGVI